MEEKKDYKKLYLKERKQSLMLEMNLMQMRADTIKAELPDIEKELREYESAGKNKETGTDKA